MAELYFRYGAMNSGKSSLILQVAHNYEEREMPVLLMKPLIDSKGNDMIVSRIGLKRKVDHLIENNDNLYEFINNYNQAKKIYAVLVDEAQFIEEEQVDQLLEVVTKLDIPVICYGLRVDFLQNGFPGSNRLLLLSHKIEEMKTVCRCGRKAMDNARIINGEFVFEGDQVAIDGLDDVKYISLCHHCYLEEKEKSLKKEKVKIKIKSSLN